MKGLAKIIAVSSALWLTACGEEPWHTNLRNIFSENEPGSWEQVPCDEEELAPGISTECGVLTVREVRSDDNSRKLLLPLKRYSGQAGGRAPAVFFLAGGPGQSNMTRQPDMSMLEHFSFVTLGYRGVDGSVRLECPEFTTALPRIERFFSDDYNKAIAASFEACLSRYEADGVRIEGYSIPEVIGDLEAARKALGYERINLLSSSYGTRIALLYAHTLPQALDRSVLLKANPPGHMVWDAAQTDDKVRKLAAYCAMDAACAARTDDLAETINTVLRNAPERWLFLGIDPGRVRAASFGLLYSASTAPMVADAFLDAAEGDASGLALLSKAMDFFALSGTIWGDLMLKGASSDFDPASASVNDFYPDDAILGAPMSQLLWPTFDEGMVPLIAEIYREPQTSSVPTLIVSGELDVSTPPENARDEIMPYLAEGYQVTLVGAGHMDIGGPEVEKLATTFLHTGEVVADNLPEITPNFSPRLTFGLMAKSLVGALVGVLALLGLAVSWIVLRIGRGSRRRT